MFSLPGLKHLHRRWLQWGNGCCALHTPIMQSDQVSLPVRPQVSHSRVSDIHKAIYSWQSNRRNSLSWCLWGESPTKKPPHSLHVGKSCSSPVFSSCSVSRWSFTYLVSSLCTLCYAKDWQFTDSCLSGLSPRAQSASWTIVYKPSYLHQVYCPTESWTWDIESAGPCHEFFSIRPTSRRGFCTLCFLGLFWW